MPQPARRPRSRVDTERDIRQHARELLVEQGHEAVTLRAIARGLGITAPALYRYYSSRAALLDQLRVDICVDLAEQMVTELAKAPEDDAVEQVRAACRGFRGWSVAHPREFVLSFASLMQEEETPPKLAPAQWPQDGFGKVFLSVAGQVLATHELAPQPVEAIPDELVADLATFRDNLLGTIAERGVVLTEARLSIGATYQILQFWVRLYGHVALEVFGRFPGPLSNPDALFEANLTSLIRDIGLTP
ncbi:TetR family transcriptional regulator [Tamaricihabitans halophyticus]|uniref:TetR family transcriptional regulator n=1 Tax=Tamaricihabitans halophyticus TaxID=1262583 RepID=A0A4R2RDD2_9PSEU|nr:TetR/AcrR family transcriptional regulator [Tamaricihabitans halophyticus]TCP57415.1 TetR family transcriptional regulator [Tamaricihabitans halophyticus]